MSRLAPQALRAVCDPASLGFASTEELSPIDSMIGQDRAMAATGINEKIEGFFDLCRARGLTGEHGVLIPAANARHLMLRDDVVAAAAAGRFHLYAVRTVDEGLALLSGRDAGAPPGE